MKKSFIIILIFIVLALVIVFFLYKIRYINIQPENCGVVGCYSKDYKGRTLLNGQPFGGAENGWK